MLILPALTLVLAVAPYIVRILRASMIEVLESEYVQMARLKGMPERIVLRRHALPNAVIPAIQVIALNLAWLAGGVVVVEYLFNYPGIGSGLVDAVANRDVPVIQAIVLLIAGLYVGFNLLADILTILVSPRLQDGTPMSADDLVPAGGPPMSDLDLGPDEGINEPLEPRLGQGFDVAPVRGKRRRREWVQLLVDALHYRRTQIGLGLFLVIVALAVVGPYVAPYSPSEFVTMPFAKPSSDAVLGRRQPRPRRAHARALRRAFRARALASSPRPSA